MNPRKGMFYWQADRPYNAQQIKSIFLDRKVNFDPKSIIEAVIHGLISAGIEKNPDLTLEPPINFGSVNIVCPFKTKLGYEGIIRAFPPSIDNSYFYVEKEAMALARQAGVKTATVTFVSLDKKQFPFHYMLMDRIPGTIMQEEVEKNPELYKTYLNQVGQNMALIHSVKTSGYGFFDNKLAASGILKGQYQSNEENFTAALDKDEEFYSDKQSWIDASQVKKAIRVLRTKKYLAKCDTPVLIHNDIADWNTVVKGNLVTGIFDWDECFSGDPLFEFATAKLFYPDARFDYLLTGYKQIAKIPDDFGEKFDLYVMRYIISKTKISINKLISIEKKSTRERFETAKKILKELLQKF